MLFEIILSFILTSLIFGFIPGPSVCFTIAYGIKFGTSATIPSIVGQLAANFLQVLLVLIGLNSLLEQSIELFYILKMAGAFYLVYLGIKQWFAGKRWNICRSCFGSRSKTRIWLPIRAVTRRGHRWRSRRF